jgi:uncharacterized protein (DUF1499 family)
MAGSVAASARWSLRLAVVGAAVFVLGPVAAHLRIVPPLTGFSLFGLGGLVSLIAFVVAIVAFALNRDESRTTALWGVVLAGMCTSVFLAAAVPNRGYPRINDITTDTRNPPQFMAALEIEANRGRDMSYPGEEFARQQQEGYPDLGPLAVGGAPAEVYERVVAAARAMPSWEVTRTDAAARTLEGFETSFLFRFRDDFVVEVRPQNGGSAVHMRSKSRDGRGDVGANAARIRSFFAALK